MSKAMHARFWILVSFCMILLGGCAPQQAEAVTPTLNSGVIGTISRVNDNVERGQSAGKMIPVTANDPLNAGDFLQVSKGGEGLLDFGNYLQLRVFNDTKLQAITLQHADNIPLYARIQLETGGFTGTLQKKEGKAVFETPNGATISILGTQFWVIYNPIDKVVGVGNFGGTISVSAQNITRAVTSNHYLIVKDGQPPEPERVLSISRAGLENLIRKQGSPLTVLQTAFETTATPTAATPTATPIDTLTPADTLTPTLTVTPTPTPACPPTLHVVRAALCRVSPGTSKEVMNVFPLDATMIPSKRTFSDPVWWNVPEPASGLSCWISSANLEMIGDASCVPLVGLVPGNAATQTAVVQATPAGLQSYRNAPVGNATKPAGSSFTTPASTSINSTAPPNPYP